MQKRLGDGFYEQRLVRDQLMALTGKSITTAGDDSAYQAMLNSGVSYAQQWDLRPGIALTADQIAQLTSDIVWLENQTVRLPDGSVQTALVPKVYVAKLGDKAVTPSGALVTGGSVEIFADQITNRGGLIDGGNGRTVLVASNDINNLGGVIRGGEVGLYADGNIRNESLVVSDSLPMGQTRVMASNDASITASGDLTISAGRDVVNVAGLLSAGRGATGGDAIIFAGRDILLDSQALVDNRSMSGGDGQADTESLTHRQSQLDTGGDLTMVAGRDLTLNAAQLLIGTNPDGAGYAGAGVLQAGRDLSLNAVIDSYASRMANGTDPKNSSYLGWSAESVLGTQIVAGGDLSLRAGASQTGNLGIAGSAVASGGALALKASGDILLTTVEQTKDYAHKAQSSSSGFLSSRSSTSIGNNSETLAIGSSLSGQTVALQADRDISIEGARVVAQDDLAMKAGRDLTITSAEERSSADSFEESRRSGFVVESYLGYRSTAATDAGDGTSVTQRGSLISGDNVYLDAGRDLGILGSTVVAEGDLGLKAVRNIDIVSTQNSSEQSSESHRKESGVLGGFDRPSIGTISVNQDGQGQNVEQVGSMIGSLGGNVNIDAGGRYTQTASDVTAAAGFAGSANGNVGNIVIRAGEVLINEAMNTAGSQQHASERKTAIGPTMDIPLLNAARSLRDVAQAAGETSDGRSQAMAAATVAMQARDIASGVQGAIANPESLQAGFKVGFALSASRSESSMSQQSETSVGSTVRGSGNVTIVASGIDGDESAGNVTVIGSQVQAGGNVVLSALDRINLLASKDTFTQTSNSSSSGASIGIGLVAGGTQNGLTFELAANRARANADGTDTTYRNTNIEGGNGVTLISGGDTTLRGATITAPRVSGLIGGDLNITSLQDISRYDSKQSSAGISASLCIFPFCTGVSYVSGSVAKSTVDGDFTSVTETSGIRAGDGGFQLNVAGNTNLQGGIIASSDKAVIDGKNLLYTSTLTTSDLLNRDVYEASGYSFSATVSTGAPGGSAGVGSASGDQESVTRSGISGGTVVIKNSAAQQALTGYSAEEALASLDRNVTSSTADASALSKAWDAARLQREVKAQVTITSEFGKAAAKEIGDYAKTQMDRAQGLRDAAGLETDEGRREVLLANAQELEDNWKEGGTLRVAAHAAVGGLSGGIAGALGTGASAMLMPAVGQLIKSMNLPAGLQQVVGAATAAAIGSIGGTAGASGAFNTDLNNRMLHDTEKVLIRDLAGGDPETEARLAVAACALIHCAAEFPIGSEGYAYFSMLEQAGAGESFVNERALLSQQRGLFEYSTSRWTYSDANQDAFKRLNNELQLSTRAGGVLSTIGGVGSVIAGAALTTVGGIACAPTAGGGCLVAVGGAVIILYGLDKANAGVMTVATGQNTSTVGGILIANSFGISPEAAELTYGLVGDVAGLVRGTISAVGGGKVPIYVAQSEIKIGGSVVKDATTGVAITIEPKIAEQMGKRGWTEESLAATIKTPGKTVVTKDTRFDPISGRRLNDPATGYVAKDGSYVVVNDRTGAIVQVSNKNDPNWAAPWD